MNISWYPGHMHQNRKALDKLLQQVIAVIEVLDARAPKVTTNPIFSETYRNKPCIKILCKADLANPEATTKWQKYFDTQPNTVCLTSALESTVTKKLLLQAVKRVVDRKSIRSESKHDLVIIGIPNVGKSTLLNKLAKRKLAKTGNEPALTRSQQRIRLDDSWHLIDTPGILWPKLENQDKAFVLAMLGSIRNTAFETEEIGWFAAELLLAHFRTKLITRYGLSVQIRTPDQLLLFIAQTRGGISKGTRPNFHKASETLLNDIRSGKLGPLSLEHAPG